MKRLLEAIATFIDGPRCSICGKRGHGARTVQTSNTGRRFVHIEPVIQDIIAGLKAKVTR